MTTQVTRALSETEIIFKNIVWDPLIMMGETALFTNVPILAAPILGTIDREIISLVSDFLFGKLILFIDVTAIKFIDAAHQSQYDSASEALKIISLEKGMNSAEYLQAQSAAIAAMQKFTRLLGQS